MSYIRRNPCLVPPWKKYGKRLRGSVLVQKVNARTMNCSSEDLSDEDSPSESMLDVIARAHAYLGAAYSSSEWSHRSSTAGEPSTSYGAGSTGSLSRRDSDCVILGTFPGNRRRQADGVPVLEPVRLGTFPGNRRRQADGVPVVESVSLDDTLSELEVNPAPSTSRKPADNAPTAPAAPPVPVACPICLESVFERQAATAICGHLFCLSCITLEVNLRPKCPMCQRPLKPSQIIPLYGSN